MDSHDMAIEIRGLIPRTNPFHVIDAIREMLEITHERRLVLTRADFATDARPVR